MTKAIVLSDPDLLLDLTPKEQAFVQHPLVMHDPMQAALDVGYSPGYAKQRAYSKRKELMYFVSHYNKQRMAKHEITVDKVIAELAAIALANDTQYLEQVDTEHGTTEVRWKNPTRLAPEQKAAIASIDFMPTAPQLVRNADGEPMFDEEGNPITIGEHGQVLMGVRLYNKLKALETLGKFLGLENVRPVDPADPNDEQRKMLEAMTPEELDEVRKIFGQATDRIQKTAAAKRDAQAINGESQRVK